MAGQPYAAGRGAPRFAPCFACSTPGERRTSVWSTGGVRAKLRAWPLQQVPLLRDFASLHPDGG
jgi:hypothetical protein